MNTRDSESELLFAAVVDTARAERSELGEAQWVAAGAELQERELCAVSAAVLARLAQPTPEVEKERSNASPDMAPRLRREQSAAGGSRRVALGAILFAAAAAMVFLYRRLSPEGDAALELHAERVPARDEASGGGERSGATLRIPELVSWSLSGSDPGDYDIGTQGTGKDGDARRWLASRGEVGGNRFGTLMTSIRATGLEGHRLRFRARVEAQEARDWAGLWLRVDGNTGQLAFDNMQDRPLKGTLPAREYAVVADVPPGARSIAFGVLLAGTGRVLIDDVVIDDWPAPTALQEKAGAWYLAGSMPQSYEQGDVVEHGLVAAHFLRSKAETVDGFGTAMMMSDAMDARGQRFRFSAKVRSENVKSWAGLWLRLDDAAGHSLEFDNMEGRPIKGTTAWTEYHVVLDVPQQAQRFAFGALLAGTGQLWFKDVALESVDKSVPTTGKGPGQ